MECVDSIVQTWVMVELMLLLKEVFSNFKIFYIPLRGAKGREFFFFWSSFTQTNTIFTKNKLIIIIIALKEHGTFAYKPQKRCRCNKDYYL